MNFVELYLIRQVTANDIHDFIDMWHEDITIRCELHDYLGFDWNEYVEWVHNPSDLDSILSLRSISDDE
jgi:hypothetical protein